MSDRLLSFLCSAGVRVITTRKANTLSVKIVTADACGCYNLHRE